MELRRTFIEQSSTAFSKPIILESLALGKEIVGSGLFWNTAAIDEYFAVFLLEPVPETEDRNGGSAEVVDGSHGVSGH